jgi:AraC family chitin signaling transcriptional activator
MHLISTMVSGIIRFAVFLQLMMVVCPVVGQNLKFETYLVEDGMSNNSVNRLAKDPKGAIWIATWNGLNYFDGKTFVVYHHDPNQSRSLPGNYIHGVAVDAGDRVWAWAAPESVSLFISDGSFVHHSFPTRINQFFLDKDGDLLLEAGQVYYAYDDGAHQFIPRKGQLDDSIPQTIGIPDALQDIELWKSIRDKAGNTWYASKNEGLFFQPYDARVGDRLEHYKSDYFYSYALKSNEVTDLLEDDFGNIWLGLKDGGLARAIKGSRTIHHLISHPTTHPELPNESIRAILEDAEGTLWIGFYNSGVYTRKADEKQFTKFEIEASSWTPEWDRIRSLYLDRQGQVWIGSYGGVIITNSRRQKQFLQDGSFGMGLGRVYGFAEDSERKKVWLGSWYGVACFDQLTGELEDFEGRNLLEGLHIRSLFFEGETLYISTENKGLVIFKDGKARFLDTSNGLLDNSVYTVFKEATSDRMWIGTHSGVSIWNIKTNELTSLTQKNGLQSNFVYGIHGHGNAVWVSTARGIARINRETLEVTSFDPAEGWQSAEFSQGASFKATNGQLYFGGVNGLNSFHPNDLEQLPNLPKLFVHQIDPENSAPYTASFQVESIGFGVNSTNRIEYRFLPGQESWETIEPSGLLNLHTLKAGVYQLELRNTLDPQLAPVELEFHIEVPWYHDPKYYFALVLAVIALVGWWRYRSHKMLQRKLERKIQERTHVILEQKGKLELANLALEKKNQEIQSQKDSLLVLHSKLQNSNFEIDQFAAHLVEKIRMPLSDLRLGVETSTFRDSSLKANIEKQLDQMMEVFNELNLPNELSELGELKPSLTYLPDLFDSLNAEIHTYPLAYRYEEDHTQEWVSVDLMRLKLMLQLLFRELLKFLEDSAELDLHASSERDQLQLSIQVRSVLLQEGIDALQRHSLYFSAVKRLIRDLSGKMEIHTAELPVQFSIQIPLEEASSETPEKTLKNWRHLELLDKIPEDKEVILFYGKQYEAGGLLKVFEDDAYFLMQEQDPAMVISALSTLKVDLLVIHNESKLETIELIVRNQRGGNSVPFLYLYEQLSDRVQEKLMDRGIKEFIQLPTSKALLLKKVKQLLTESLDKRQTFRWEGILALDDTDLRLSPNEKLVKEAILLIRVHFEDPGFRVETIYETLGVSKIKLYRVFKEVVQSAPSDFILQMRMEKAISLLQRSRMNISEICYECGFNDPKHFSRVFKKYAGESPKRYQLVAEM